MTRPAGQSSVVMAAVREPWFSAGEPAVADFWAVYDAHYDDIQRALQALAAGHPEFGPLLRAMTPEQLAQQNAQSREALRRAVHGGWAEYEKNLMEQGAVYARMGIGFGSWFEIVRATNRELVPRLVRAYATEPERLAAAQLAWDDFISRALRVIGEAYLEKKRELLRASDERNAAIVEASLDPIVVMDEGGRITTFNAAAERFFGHSRADVAGKRLADVIIPERLREGHERGLARYLATGEGAMLGRRVEVTALRADGAEVPVELAVTAMRIAGGATFTGHIRDLSGRKREQEAIAVWTHVLEQGEFGLVVVDVATRTIRFVNPRFARMYGYADVDDLVGKRVETVVATEWTTEFEEALREIDNKGHHTFEAIQRRRDGTTFPALVSTTVIRTPNNGELRVSNVLDLTERRRAAEERERARTLELENRRVMEASRLKSEFLANMSHELRTPLNSIIGFAEILLSGDVLAGAPEHDEFLGDIHASGRHLLRLINDVLDLSKVEAGKLDFRPEWVAFAEVGGEVLAIVRSMAAAKKLRIAMEDPDALRVFVDPARLKQVLYNYLSNAIKFTEPGGTVHLSARAERGDAFRIEVRDTGVGIAPGDLGRLFVEFQQLEQGAAKRHAGTGLGLALTKRLVEAMGGVVGVESTPGAGSTFYALLPIRTAGGTALPEPRRIAARTAGAPCVLVVEDDASDQQIIVSALVAAGFEVETAATGAQAIQAARARSFDAITLDLLLPDRSGREVLTAVRARGASRAAKVVVVSVVAEKGAVGGLAVDDFVAKPIDDAALVAALERLGVVGEAAARVLVVDDDPASLRLVHATLAPLGYHVIGRPDGASALTAAAEERPHVVILDLLMPVMDGFEFLARFRADPANRDVPVIVWTSQDLTREQRGRLRESALSVVLKGQGARSLVDELASAVRRPAHADEEVSLGS
ncbi:MAG TPA: PAS domain S-box protein [Minicystis sp.]|nr:PAS domain S-box protein [Minicystis sp.]